MFSQIEVREAMQAEAIEVTGDATAIIAPVLTFLNRRTPFAWVERAVEDLDTLLNDHASLELKAAQQAQKLIRTYGVDRPRGGWHGSDEFRSALINRMSRLAREELRHFEQVISLIEARGGRFQAVSASRYAARLHQLARRHEPQALIDLLIIGAIIEARSCERFFSLIERPISLDRSLAKFYASLLRAEARHFEDYLQLARQVSETDISERVDDFLALDTELTELPDTELRFLSGPPDRANSVHPRT